MLPYVNPEPDTFNAYLSYTTSFESQVYIKTRYKRHVFACKWCTKMSNAYSLRVER